MADRSGADELVVMAVQCSSETQEESAQLHQMLDDKYPKIEGTWRAKDTRIFAYDDDVSIVILYRSPEYEAWNAAQPTPTL